MALKLPSFSKEDLAIDQNLGYPKAYSKLCASTSTTPYSHGPPLSFIPYTLHPQEALRAKDLNHMFPIIDPDAQPAPNPRGYVNLLWKQLDHLGNAGFDPALFRIDPYGNVVYLHADSGSPLAWDIDHWFPCSRGGRTLPSNLRILQWQVCKKKKKNKLEFLVPWWDLQLGISVNQFLSIFASKNSDFRNRAFSFLFQDGGSEELNALQAVDSHKFPQHFVEMKQQLGLAPAAIVSTQRSSDSSILQPLNINKSLRHSSPFPGIKKFSSNEDDGINTSIHRIRPNTSKENEVPESDDFAANPYLSITRARDALRQREEIKKKETEMSQLEDELNGLRQKNESDRVALQELEALLIKRRRRVEKCRRLAEAQSSYKSMLEKMIRDAMHQSVVYKEQLRLNQASTSTLMARLEAQRAICDNSENELRRKYNQRDEIEKQIIRPCWEEQARKRSRMDYTLFEERNEDCSKGWTPSKKELRAFLEEEQKLSEAGISPREEEENGRCKSLVLVDGELKTLRFREGSCSRSVKVRKNSISDTDTDEKLLDHKLAKLTIKTNEICEEEADEENRKQAGKGNVEKWLQMMLENAKEGSSENDSDQVGTEETAEPVDRLNETKPEKEIKYLRLKPLENSRSFNEKGSVCESSRVFRSVPSSPTMMLNSVASSSSSSKFIKSCTRTIKRAVNI